MMRNKLLLLTTIPLLCSNLFLAGQTKADTELSSVYPPFSWEKVPVYIHFGCNDGLSDEEINIVATHSDIVCFEKGHGINPHGSTEAGIEFDGQRLKEVNPDLKLIYYWNTFLDYSMYDAHSVYESHPEWWLRKLDGELDLKRGTLKRYDLSNPEVREWWAEEVRKAVLERSCDGVFMDAFPQITSAANIALWGQEKFDSIQDGLIQLIQLTRQKTDSSALLLYNGIRNTDALHFGMDYIEITDGSTIEHFAHFSSTSRESIASDLEDMITAGKQGKMVVMKGWPGFNWTDSEKMKQPYEELLEEARENITFPLACFLIAAQTHSYFVYTWGYRENHGSLDWYDEFDRPLGEPLGDATKDGWEYTREFEHVKVWVNIDTKEAKIEWEGYTPPSEQRDSMVIERSPYDAADSLLFSFIPDYHSDSIPDYSGNHLFSNKEYQPSGSVWHEQCKEEDVYMARLTHKTDPDSVLWDLRISRGGAIYSFIGPYGEGVPPQYRSWDFNTARWVDDLWQTVALSTEKHNADVIPAPPGSTLGRPQVPSMRYFIHGAGVYMNDTMFARTNKPFYSPLMASWYDKSNRAFHSMNWGQQAHIPSIHKSQLLYSYKYKDLGSGIMEATHIIQNFGDHKVDYLNMPWGGVRALNLPQCWLSHPNDSLERTYKLFGSTDPGLVDIDQSGGYFIWAAEGDNENRPAMALVYGKDKHFIDYQSDFNMQPTRIRWGDGSGDANRSYSVFTVNPRLGINPGSTFYYRVFYINGTMKEVAKKAQSLVDASDYGFISPEAANSPLIVIKQNVLDSAFNEDIKLYASPVKHMVPLFLMEDTISGKQYISPDLYYKTSTLPFSNPYEPGNPKFESYQDQIVLRPYTETVKFIRLLGYGVNVRQLAPDIQFALLDTMVRDTSRVIIPSDYRNAIWIPLGPCDTCYSEPEPDFMLYNDFGPNQRFPWVNPLNMTFMDMVPNPQATEVNPSQHCGKVFRGSGTWAHVHFNLPETLDLTENSTFKVKAYYEGSEPVPEVCKVRLILRNNGLGTTQFSLVKPVKVVNQWVEYTFECSNALGRDNYNQVWLFFSSPDEDGIAEGHTYYIDELMGPPLSLEIEENKVTFSVLSGDTGTKLSGIPVNMGGQTTLTDIQGNAEFELEDGFYSYAINASGYFPVDSSIELHTDTVIHIELLKTSSNLEFRIISENTPVPEAEVEVEAAMLQTNTFGIAMFEELDRYMDYSYTVQKVGYHLETGSVYLVRDTSITVNLQILISAGNAASQIIQVYPNPACTKLILESGTPISGIEFFSIHGNLIQSYKIEAATASLDISDIQPGMYILKIYPENGIPVMRQLIVS